MQEHARVQCCASSVKYLTRLPVKYIQKKNGAAVRPWARAETALGFVVVLVEYTPDGYLRSPCKAPLNVPSIHSKSARVALSCSGPTPGSRAHLRQCQLCRCRLKLSISIVCWSPAWYFYILALVLFMFPAILFPASSTLSLPHGMRYINKLDFNLVSTAGVYCIYVYGSAAAGDLHTCSSTDVGYWWQTSVKTANVFFFFFNLSFRSWSNQSFFFFTSFFFGLLSHASMFVILSGLNSMPPSLGKQMQPLAKCNNTTFYSYSSICVFRQLLFSDPYMYVRDVMLHEHPCCHRGSLL